MVEYYALMNENGRVRPERFAFGIFFFFRFRDIFASVMKELGDGTQV
jgi:hypothetical protein